VEGILDSGPAAINFALNQAGQTSGHMPHRWTNHVLMRCAGACSWRAY